MPAPPMPTRWIGRALIRLRRRRLPSRAGRGRRSRGRRRRGRRAMASASSATRSAASGRPAARAASAMASRRWRSDRSAPTRPLRCSPVHSASGRTTAAPASDSQRAFLAWWSAVAWGYGTRIDGRPIAASSKTEPPAARHHQVRGGDRARHVVEPPDQPVGVAGVAPVEQAPRLLQQAGAGHVDDVHRGRAAEGLDGGAVQAAGALAAADHQDGGRPGVDPEGPPAGRARGGGHGPAHRAAGHQVAPAGAAGERERQRDPPRQRRGQAVGGAEVRVGLHEHERAARQPRRQGHRPGDVPARADHDVGAAAGEQRGRARDGDRRLRQRDQVPRRQAPREAAHGEQVLGVAGRLDRAGRARPAGAHEADLSPPRAQRVGHRQRRHHVTARPAGGDQRPHGVGPRRGGRRSGIGGRC